MTRFRRGTYERLKELSFVDLKGDVGMFLSDDEIRDWLSTAQQLVDHIDGESQKRSDVFFQEREVALKARRPIGARASEALWRRNRTCLFRLRMKRR